MHSRKRKLHQLYAVSRHIERSKPFPPSEVVSWWGSRDNGDIVLEELEKRFIDDNDLEKCVSLDISPFLDDCLLIVGHRGLMFNEASLPTYSLPYSGHPPEPGGQNRNPTVTRTPAPSRPLQRVQTPAPVVAPAKPIVSVPVLTPQSPPKPTPSPILQDTPISTVEVRTNGHVPENVPTPKEEVAPLPATKKLRTTPPVQSPPVASPLPIQKDASTQETGEAIVDEGAAPVVDEGGVPVIQGNATVVPNERERAAGVHPPPIPADLDREDTKMSDTESMSSTRPETPVALVTTTKLVESHLSPPVLEIQKPIALAATSPSLLIEQGATPQSPTEILQLPGPAPLSIVTEQRSIINSVTEKYPLPEVSSPASSVDIDASTPGNIISSATSPDANQIPEPSKPENGTEGHASYPEPMTEETPAEREREQEGERTPIIIEEERPKTPEVVEVPLTTTPPRDTADNVDEKEVPREEREGELSVARVPSPMVEDQLPVSPDPSAQLRLENQLANGVLQPIATGKEGIKSHPPSPEQKASDLQNGSSPEMKKPVEEEDEEEDQVQLVESTSPKLPAPRESRGATPQAETTHQEPTPGTQVEKPTQDGVAVEANSTSTPTTPNVEAQSTPQAILTPAARPDPQPETPHPEAEVEAVPEPKSPPAPDSMMIPVDNDSDSETEDEDIVMQDSASQAPLALVERPCELIIRDAQKSATPTIFALETPPRPSERLATPEDEDDEVDSITVPEDIPESPVSQHANPKEPRHVPVPSTETTLAQEPNQQIRENENLPTPSQTQDDLLVPATATRSSSRQKKPTERAAQSTLTKVVISSSHHAQAAEAARAKRLREDQEQQGLIVVARRLNQQAAAGAARGRPSLFPPGTRLEALTRYTVEEDTPKEPKVPDYMDSLYTVKSMPGSLGDLLARSSKCVSTADHMLAIQDRKDAKILMRVQELQDMGLWSLQQIQRSPEPPRPKTHQDYMLAEMKWLRADFREERKLKIMQCKMMADICVEWHQAPPEHRWKLQVDKVKWGWVPFVYPDADELADNEMDENENQPTPELMASGGTPDEGSDDEFVKEEGQDEDTIMDLGDGAQIYDHINDLPPAAIFSLRADETIFCMPATKAAEETMAQLPLYAPPAPPAPSAIEYADEPWLQTPLIPVTKYASGKMKFVDEDRPLRKRSRYEYEANTEAYADDSDEEGEVVNGDGYDSYGRPGNRDKTNRPLPLQPEQQNCALFRPEFKPTLQRVRARSFQPPANLPPVQFFDHRNPSLWTAEEDDNLRILVKEYSHNWSLISEIMKHPGNFESGASRRSQWECFERWMQIDHLPQEFMKSQHCKGVQQRVEIAAKASERHINAAASGVQPVSQLKRRGTLPMKVERGRTTRTFSQLDAMRKLAKKRETNMNKQAQSSRG